MLLLAATALSGASGYIIAIIVPLRTGVAGYAAFSTAWSLLFFLVGAAGGVQQEVTRSSTASLATGRRGTARPAVFATAAGMLAAALVIGTSPIWQPGLIDLAGAWAGVAIGIGVGSYVGIAVVAGLLYGISGWIPLAVLIAVDGVLRLLGIIVVLAAGGSSIALVWAIVVPFPLALLVGGLVLRRRLGSIRLDVATGPLAWNALRLVVAAGATAALVSGIPFLIRAAMPWLPAAEFAPVALALTITRAPIVIPLLALQSYLIARFSTQRSLRGPVTVAGAVLAAALLISLGCALIGPMIIRTVFGDEYALDPLPLGLIVASSGALAALTVLGAAAIAGHRHGAVTVAWIVAVAVTVVGFLLPLPAGLRIGVALLGGATMGLVTLIVVLAATAGSRRTAGGASGRTEVR